MSRVKLWTGLIVLFAAGFLSGVAGTWSYHNYEREHRGERGPGAQHQRIMNRLTQELNLTAEQQTEVAAIVTRAQLAILELRFSHQTEVEDILTRGISELKVTLSAEQQTRLDEMYARIQQRWHKSREYLNETKRKLAWLAPGRRVQRL